MRIKRDPADIAFSQYIRRRDGECLRCKEGGRYSPVRYNDKGEANSHQASHYFGRGKESTRFDPANVDTLCGACHRIWGSDDREAYREFKVNQLGPSGFQALVVRANQIGKKDRKLALIQAKALLALVDKPSGLKS